MHEIIQVLFTMIKMVSHSSHAVSLSHLSLLVWNIHNTHASECYCCLLLHRAPKGSLSRKHRASFSLMLTSEALNGELFLLILL